MWGRLLKAGWVLLVEFDENPTPFEMKGLRMMALSGEQTTFLALSPLVSTLLKVRAVPDEAPGAHSPA